MSPKYMYHKKSENGEHEVENSSLKPKFYPNKKELSWMLHLV